MKTVQTLSRIDDEQERYDTILDSIVDEILEDDADKCVIDDDLDDDVDEDDLWDTEVAMLIAASGLDEDEWFALNYADGAYTGPPNPVLDAYRAVDPYLADFYAKHGNVDD